MWQLTSLRKYPTVNKIVVLFFLIVSFGTWASEQTAVFNVEGHGPTQEQAKKVAFNNAVERAVGQLVIGHRQVVRDDLKEDSINSYTSGYIEHYDVVGTKKLDDGSWIVKINAVVSSSDIALAWSRSSNPNIRAIGFQLEQRIKSIIADRENGDRLVEQVMSTYPESAYVLTADENNVKFTRNRQPYFTIPYTISMNNDWLSALVEALSFIAEDSKSCSTLTMVLADGLKSQSGNYTRALIEHNMCDNSPDIRVFQKVGWLSESTNFYLKDHETMPIINQALRPDLGQQRIGIRVDFLDANGYTIDTSCIEVNNETFIRYNSPNVKYVNLNRDHYYQRPDIVGQNLLQGVINVPINNISQLREMTNIELSVEKTCR